MTRSAKKKFSILSINVYGWFSRVARGLYALTPKGRTALAQYPELVRHYRSLPVTQSATSAGD
jgi:hypothetical protein